MSVTILNLIIDIVNEYKLPRYSHSRRCFPVQCKLKTIIHLL